MTETRPVRLRLSRAKGYSLKAHSLATNGLLVTNVARPSAWGNPFAILNEEGWPLIVDTRNAREPAMNAEAASLLRIGESDLDWDQARPGAVALYRELVVPRLPPVTGLRFRNLACWCPLPEPGQPDCCHAAVLLRLANPEEASHGR